MPREPPVIRATLPERDRGMDMKTSLWVLAYSCKSREPEGTEIRIL
jgi:hypothetical protein